MFEQRKPVPPRRRRWSTRSWERDLAMREARTPAEAAERAHRGAALVRAALAGTPPPELVKAKPATPRPAGYEYVACVGCYRPVWGLPGSRCDSCPPSNTGSVSHG